MGEWESQPKKSHPNIEFILCYLNKYFWSTSVFGFSLHNESAASHGPRGWASFDPHSTFLYMANNFHSTSLTTIYVTSICCDCYFNFTFCHFASRLLENFQIFWSIPEIENATNFFLFCFENKSVSQCHANDWIWRNRATNERRVESGSVHMLCTYWIVESICFGYNLLKVAPDSIRVRCSRRKRIELDWTNKWNDDTSFWRSRCNMCSTIFPGRSVASRNVWIFSMHNSKHSRWVEGNTRADAAPKLAIDKLNVFVTTMTMLTSHEIVRNGCNKSTSLSNTHFSIDFDKFHQKL